MSTKPRNFIYNIFGDESLAVPNLVITNKLVIQYLINALDLQSQKH